jgi:hypothetical protein
MLLEHPSIKPSATTSTVLTRFHVPFIPASPRLRFRAFIFVFRGNPEPFTGKTFCFGKRWDYRKSRGKSATVILDEAPDDFSLCCGVHFSFASAAAKNDRSRGNL